MIDGKYDYIKKWQNEVFDDKMKEELLKSLLSSEIKRFSIFLDKKGKPLTDAVIDEYAKERGLVL